MSTLTRLDQGLEYVLESSINPNTDISLTKARYFGGSEYGRIRVIIVLQETWRVWELLSLVLEAFFLPTGTISGSYPADC